MQEEAKRKAIVVCIHLFIDVSYYVIDKQAVIDITTEVRDIVRDWEWIFLEKGNGHEWMAWDPEEKAQTGSEI